MSILDGLFLTGVVGAIVGWVASIIFRWPLLRCLASIAVGAFGSVIAGFILPQLGLPVSKGAIMGVITCAVGAVTSVSLLRIVLK